MSATVSVSAEALRQVLVALTGSAYRIRELQATRNIAGLTGDENPIDTLIKEYNQAWEPAPAAKPPGLALETGEFVPAADLQRPQHAATVQTATILPAFMGVAKRKLDELVETGWRINGFAISNTMIGPERHGFITVGGMVGWWRSPEEERQLEAATVERALRNTIQLTPAEIQSGHDRVRWAEGLIKQLPEDHDGRNSWLLNYGSDKEARQAEWARRNGKTLQPVIQHVPADDTEGGAL